MARDLSDRAYKQVFSNPQVLRSFLTDFVPEPWVALVDFSSLRVASAEFPEISRGRRTGDLLLELTLADRSRALVFLLLEFQSNPEAMALRLLEYMLRIYRRQRERSAGKLSVVAPMVIYNGDRPWREDVRFAGSFRVGHESLRRFIPDFSYLLVDVKELDEGRLRELGSEVACFFLLDKTDLRQAEAAARRIGGIFRELVQGLPAAVRRVLEDYVLELISLRGERRMLADSELRTLLYSERGVGMLAQSIERLYEKGRVEGRVEGVQGVARRMLAEGFSVEEIARATGLPEEKIRALEGRP